ncbi:MAG: lysine--tRNA ligase [Betaproteobacteria bacterium]|nr:lysine--tRNA ligase [Betaproteobacteria bacterium]
MPTEHPPQDENHVIAERRAKLKSLREAGLAYPNDFVRNHLAVDLLEKYGNYDRDSLDLNPVEVQVAGRLMLRRTMGKLSFGDLQDMSGTIQVFVADNFPGKAEHECFKKQVDIGDIVGIDGVLFKTQKGELTVRVRKLRLLAKCLRPLPEKWHGLSDQETRYRSRHLDLITNDDSRLRFVQRSRAIQAVRQYLLDRRYLEVETPMMQPIPGGAAARPFVTHHNALDMELYLRIAPELYLKRLVVGGYEKVFEINRNFRNEGISTRHNPEFTMLEFYCAYRDYRYLMAFTEEMFRYVAQSVLGTSAFQYQGREIDFAKPFDRLTVTGAIRKYHPEYPEAQLAQREFLLAELQKIGAAHRPTDGVGGLQLSLFEARAEEFLFEPTFIIDYPAEASPLARRSDKHPESTERFELYIAGREIANGFSELNDPEDQAERFREQARQKAAGDHEAMHYDADYIRALEYGLPPTAGEGVGIDRLVMLLTDTPSIRDVILFPLLRSEDAG